MENKFVCPADRLQGKYRELTRDNEMIVGKFDGTIMYTPKNLPASLVFPNEEVPKFANTQEKIDSWFSERGGINLCDSYQTERGIRPGGVRLCSGAGGSSPFPNAAQAYEPLSFGVGVLRPVQTRQRGAWDCLLGTPAMPKIVPKDIRTSLYHLVYYNRKKDPERPWLVTKEVYESTNLILADSFGELEQLRNRRRDRRFLEAYLKDMRAATKFQEGAYPYPKSMFYYFEGVRRAWLNHIQIGLWNGAPESVDELNERVEFLLSNTIIDENPKRVVTDYEHLHLNQSELI